MGAVREKMIEEMKLRNFSPHLEHRSHLLQPKRIAAYMFLQTSLAQI